MMLKPALRPPMRAPMRSANSPREGVGASAFADHPAPEGYRWDFVTQDGVRVSYLNEPVVALVRIF